MSLSFSDFVNYLFNQKEKNDDGVDVNKLIFASTMNKMKFANGAVIILMLCAFIASFSAKHANAEYITAYRIVYSSVLLVALIDEIGLFYISRDFDRRYKLLTYYATIAICISQVWAIAATCVNAYAIGFVNPSLYIATSMLLPMCMYMNALAYAVITEMCDIAMIIVYIRLTNAITSPAPEPIVIATILFIRLIFALMLYFTQYTIRVRSLKYEKQQKEISDLSNAQNRFFSSMSHEIRTPINTIIGLNEMILREKVSDEVAEDAANIRAASNMLLHLINDILDMSKISSGQMRLTPVNYRPGDMLSEIVGMLWLRTKEKGLEFNIELAPDIPSELYGDEVRIKQILINVLNNAIKYTKKGSVTLTIQCNGIHDGTADIVYSVKDTGVGIKKENIPHLFTAFRRVDEEANRYIEGTGLGLSIVKQLTELMGGKVTVNSLYTQGSTFIIEIPQTVTDYTAIGSINFEEKHKNNMSGTYRCAFEAPNARVLVVDDNESNLLVAEKLLRDTKVILDAVHSGEEALAKTLERSYDLILMDHLMPEMDGIECFHKIRDQVGGLSKNAKVIALTANAGSENRKLYSSEGFDGYIVKPIDVRELEAEMIRLLPANLVTKLGNDENIVEESMSWLDSRSKKRSVLITTESVADLPPSLIRKYKLDVIAHKVETENGIFADAEEIDSDGLLEYLRTHKTVDTHAPSVKEHEDFFAGVLSKANNIVHLTVSTRVNHSSFDLASEGAAAFNNVTIFDTYHLSTGQGLMVLDACRMAAEGLSVGEIISNLEDIRKRVQTSFIVDNLDFLAQNLQVNSRLAQLGKTIMFHPVIYMKNGNLSISRFYFGSRQRAWSKYISSALSQVSDIDKRVLFVTYVGLTKKDLDFIKSLVDKKVHFDNIYFQKASPTIAVNSGPGTFGLLFERKK
ncbi:MAG: DegV family EDD domain-containing protein [Lachnospiraceae bacterium]|nr:DegV family EDD domain-containing protein [Lachnospiraceae bacterium]